MHPIRKIGYQGWVEFRYYMYRLAGVLAYRLPTRLGHVVANIIGDVVYFGMKRHSANAISNMRRVLGPRAGWQRVKTAARASFRNYVKLSIDFLRFHHLSPAEIRRLIATPPDGMENIEEAFRRGRGIIAITAHYGNWDLAGATLATMGLPLNAVAEIFEPPKMDQLINGTRRRQGMNIIPTDTNSLKELFRALRRNEIIFLLFDNPEAGEEGGVPVQFFGETAYVPGGPAALALKTKAAIVIGYGIRKPDGKTFRAFAEPPIEYERLITGDKERDIQAITQEIVRQWEAIIRRDPEQWYMFREMWPRTEENNAEVKRRRFWGGRGDVRVGSW